MHFPNPVTVVHSLYKDFIHIYYPYVILHKKIEREHPLCGEGCSFIRFSVFQNINHIINTYHEATTQASLLLAKILAVKAN